MLSIAAAARPAHRPAVRRRRRVLRASRRGKGRGRARRRRSGHRLTRCRLHLAPLARRLASRLFNRAIRALLRLPFRDTQCGLEGFRRHAALQRFNRARPDGVAFDTELLFLAHRLGLKVRRSTSTPRNVTAASSDENGGGSAGQPADPAHPEAARGDSNPPPTSCLSPAPPGRPSRPRRMRRWPGERKPPFGYETPGRGDDGTRRRQPGQVRVRRYLVTEVVTETVRATA